MGLGSVLLGMIKVGNSSALRLYESHDFEVVETLPQHYQIDNELFDAVRLAYKPRTRGCMWRCYREVLCRPWRMLCHIAENWAVVRGFSLCTKSDKADSVGAL